MKDLSNEEIRIIKECLIAAAYGPFFIDEHAKDNPYWEFSTIFGLEIKELKQIADAFPSVDMETEDVMLAINNSLNNLLGYPHNCTDAVWSKYISVSSEKLIEIYSKWRGEEIKNYIEGLM